MTKQEFLDTLGRVLRRELSEQEVAENLHYYENYISQEVQNGRSEEQVIEQLGDPRLIAKTILEVDQQQESRERMWEYGGSEQTVYSQDDYGDGQMEEPYEGHTSLFRASGWRVWLILAVVLFVLYLILSTMFAILWRLLPILAVAALALWIYRRFLS